MECIFSNVFRGGDFLRILTVLSDLMVPLLIFYVVAADQLGILHRTAAELDHHDGVAETLNVGKRKRALGV